MQRWIVMNSENQVAHLLEQVVLECLGNYLYLDKLRDKVGVVTQWGVPTWLVLQRLSKKGAQTAGELAGARHVTEDYVHKLLRPVVEAELVEQESDRSCLQPVPQAGSVRLRAHALGRPPGCSDSGEERWRGVRHCPSGELRHDPAQAARLAGGLCRLWR